MSDHLEISAALNMLEKRIEQSNIPKHAVVQAYMQHHRQGKNIMIEADLVVAIKGNCDACKVLENLPIKERLAYEEISGVCRNIILDFMQYGIDQAKKNPTYQPNYFSNLYDQRATNQK